MTSMIIIRYAGIFLVMNDIRENDREVEVHRGERKSNTEYGQQKHNQRFITFITTTPSPKRLGQ